MKKYVPDNPQVVATVTGKADLEFLLKLPDLSIPLLEFRLDNLSDCLDLVEKTILQLPSEIQVLITSRHPDEGGAAALSEIERIAGYNRFLEHSHLIDTEIRSLDSKAIQELIAKAHRKNVAVVASFHDFTSCPESELLQEKIDEAFSGGADIAKLAVVISSFSELHRIVELVESQREIGNAISAMGMGPFGKLSRLALAKAGSCLNYGYLQKENAPGQWPAAKLRELIAEI